MAADQIYGVSATYDHSSSNRVLMEWKRRARSGEQPTEPASRQALGRQADQQAGPRSAANSTSEVQNPSTCNKCILHKRSTAATDCPSSLIARVCIATSLV
jgi:hypothetical protein